MPAEPAACIRKRQTVTRLTAHHAIVTRARCCAEKPLVLSLALNISLLAAGAIAAGVLAVWTPTALQAAAYPFLLGAWAAMGAREIETFLNAAIGIRAQPRPARPGLSIANY